MQYGQLAGATFGSEKSGNPDRPPKGCCLQPVSGFTQSQNSDFHFHQPLHSIFDLRGAMLQPPFAYRNSAGGIAQSLALDQVSGEFDAVQQ